MKIKLLFLFILFSLQVYGQNDSKFYKEFNLESEVDYRFFLEKGLYNGQERHFPSLALQPEYLMEWDEGDQSLNFTGFFRLDVDENRTHWDIRELYWQWVKGNAELSVGAKKIFWGVTESAHLVDIINQTDAVESFDGEQKLGQPMVHFSYFSNIGTFDFFGMTGFRKRVFSGEKGRFRTPFLINKEDIGFESDMEEWHPELAIRWSNSVNIFDGGLSYFYGNGREPVFQFLPDGNFDIFYPINHQLGVDIQATTGSWLLKLESIYRTNEVQELFAFATGFEYTFGNIKDSGIDIGIIGEYLFDNRNELALSGLDNDLFVGSRIAFNDTQSKEILFGQITDLSKETRLFSFEANRRLGDSWKLELEARIFTAVDEEEFLYFFRDDSFLELSLRKFF